MTRFRAPGKAFLWGEFVALRGGPAAVASVGRFVDVSWTAQAGSSWSIESSLHGERIVTLDELLNTPPEGDVLASVVQTLHAGGEALAPSGTLVVDSSMLSSSGHAPVGLGSSAATTAAVTSVLVEPGERAVEFAVEAHRLFQGGLGSGYDVLTACLGGMRTIQARDGHLISSVLDLPDNVCLFLVARSTAPKTPQVIGALNAAGPAAEPILDELASISRELESACRSGQTSEVIEGIQAFSLGEQRLSAVIGVEIVPPSVRELAASLAPLAAACKPSGAGGDALVVVVCLAGCEQSVREVVREAGFRALDAELGVLPF